MGEHAESAKGEDTEVRAKRAPVNWRRTREQGFSFVASVVRWVGLVFAAILVLHVIFVIGSANPGNGIVSFVRSWADGLSLGFRDLFTPSDEKLRVLVNYGIAAIFWLVVSAILAKILRRIGGLGS
ncbi:hypothetical protein [Amycolatopsis jiangsuensis]|uniref:YGGT family protein n=1 Tax=Amycolatopsis jiangsuensis TaxID=1181879 RepID=A0A840J309_9PSEU|nr:hypothetical protein [Amycolatopsis jiangsuensis]MBB4687674.1 hypothetical protein [Amycolatopsis jiangsuensis]